MINNFLIAPEFKLLIFLNTKKSFTLAELRRKERRERQFQVDKGLQSKTGFPLRPGEKPFSVVF